MKRKTRDKEKIVKTIIQAAITYKSKMVGRHFLYIFEGKYIEVVFRKKDFMHLTGVDSNSSAEQFYKDATKGKLRESQIYFSQRHPYDLCVKKIRGLEQISNMIETDIFILEEASTMSYTYKFGLTDLAITLCLSEDTDRDGKVVGDHYIARSLRVEDSFNRAGDAYEVQFILSKKNGEKEYSTLMYADKRITCFSFPQGIETMLSSSMKEMFKEHQEDNQKS